MMQLDAKKITLVIFREKNNFFYDFRAFQRQVYDMFRCRVWFSYLDEIEETMSTDVKKPSRNPKPAGPRKNTGGAGKPHAAYGTAASRNARNSETCDAAANAPIAASN